MPALRTGDTLNDGHGKSRKVKPLCCNSSIAIDDRSTHASVLVRASPTPIACLPCITGSFSLVSLTSLDSNFETGCGTRRSLSSYPWRKNGASRRSTQL